MKAATAPIAALSLIACTTASQTSNEPVDRCPTTDCFNQQQVRNFEVLDATTLVLYVGNQDCPFLVEFIGSSCDLTFLGSSTLIFRPDTLREEFESDIRFTRICARDIGIGVAEDPFIDSGAGDLPGTTLACHIRNVASLTDDELLEQYVDRNLAPPPPPLGTGRVTAPDEESAEPAGAREATEEGSPLPSP
jgi:hypothetical protein